MGFSITGNRAFQALFIMLIPFSAAFAAAPSANTAIIASNTGTIRGIVRDDSGSPISDATVAIFRAGTSRLLKQVVSSSDGSFLAKIVPGTYTVLAVAQGFNPTYLFGVEVGKAADLSYGLKLERTGTGNTLPEKRLDRNSSKWRIRGAQSQRSIYQNQEGDELLDENTTAENDLTENESEGRSSNRKGQTVVESYFAGSESGNFSGVNFATLLPVNEDADFVVAGQTGIGKNSPQRFEANLKLRPSEDHQLRFHSAAGWLGNLAGANKEKPLGQLSFQALDEWKIREGVILVLGFDYSRFVGAGSDDSFSPRLGLQYDLNAKTRFRTAYTSQTEEKTWSHAIDLEGENVSFAEPVSVEDLVLVENKPQMNKSRRLEFGIERVLDNSSSVDISAFFDTTLGRGVGFNKFSFDTLGGTGFDDFVADQQGRSQGISIVYTRRLNKIMTASGGYSYGSGQEISAEPVTDPSGVFENASFQSFFGQMDAEVRSGTSIRTVFRLSPRATIFAIDPFRGKLAIYDPGLSVMVTQILPTFGLPLRAKAIIDGRNLLDFQAGIFGEEGSLKLTGQHRMLRGGIQVRF